MALLYQLSYVGFFAGSMGYRDIRSQIIYSPTLINFRDPNSRFRVLAKHRSVFLIPLESQAVGFLLLLAHFIRLWAGRDSNPRRPKSSDLQSDVIDHSTTYPFFSTILMSHPSGSNRRPTVYKTVALPTELGWLNSLCYAAF